MWRPSTSRQRTATGRSLGVVEVRSIVVLLAALAVAGPSAFWPLRHAAAVDETFYAGEYWDGYATYRQGSRDLSFCAIHADYPNGISVHIALSATFELLLLLGNPSWRLTPDSEFPLRLSVDDRWSAETAGIATDSIGVIVRLGGDWDAYDALRRGEVLTVEARRQTFPFLLKGSAIALTEAARCVMDHGQATAGSDPFSLDGGAGGGASDPFSDAGGGGRHIGAKGGTVPPRNSVASLLAVAGLDDVRMLGEAELEADFPYADEAWITGDVYGNLFAYANEGQSAKDTADYQLEWLSEGCHGRFASGMKADKSRSRHVNRYFASCDDPRAEHAYVLYGTVLVTADGVLVFEHFGLPGDDGKIAAIDEQLAVTLARYE